MQCPSLLSQYGVFLFHDHEQRIQAKQLSFTFTETMNLNDSRVLLEKPWVSTNTKRKTESAMLWVQ